MADDPVFWGVAFRPALLAVAATLLLAMSHPVFAKDGGDSGGSGSDHSGSGDSGSGGHGSDDSGSGGHGSDDSGGHGSDDSGHSGSNSGRGGGDDRDGKNTSPGGKNDDGTQDRRRTYEGGWRAQIRHGRYQVFDPAGRVVINRKAKAADYRKF